MTKHLITSLLLIFLGIYQARNLTSDRNFKRPLRSYVPLSLKYGDKILFSRDVPSLISYPKCDASSRELGELGFILRYKVGQFPYDMFQSPKGKTPRRLFARDASDLIYSRAIAETKQNALLLQMTNLAATLDRAGITLVIVLVPLHIAIERDFMPSGSLPPLHQWNELKDPGPEDPYGVYQAIVDSAPLHILDLYKIYRDFRQANPDSPLYFPGDSHWSSLGITVAAQGVLNFLKQRGTEVDVGKVSFEGFGDHESKGQLISFLQLPESYVTSDPDLHWTEPLYILKKDRTLKLAAAGDGRLFVFGTSFTARFNKTGYGFAEMLAAGLGKKLTAWGNPGGGATQSLRYLQHEGFTLRRGDTVVWEMPLEAIQLDREAKIPELPLSPG